MFVFFIEKFINEIDFSDIDFEYRDSPGQKAYPAAVLVRIITLGMIYGIHSSRKLERIVRENIVFMYIAGFRTPVFSTIAAFKREHEDLITDVFLETINYADNKKLIDLKSISLDGSKTKACANKYNNLSEEDVLKLIHVIKKGIITDEEENKALENRDNKIINQEDMNKEKIKKALRESQNLKIKDNKKTQPSSKKNEEKHEKSASKSRKKPMKEAMRTNPEKYDDEMYKLIDENDFNYCGKKILRQAIENPENAHKQLTKLEKCKEMLEKTGDNTVNYTDPEARKSPNKNGIMEPGYNEQIVVDNKNGIIIAVNVTTDGNDNKQLKPMIQKTEETLQKALNLTDTQIKEKLNGTNILADYGYYNYEGIDFIENETEMTLYMPNKEQASKDKDKLRRPSNQKQKKERYGKYDMEKDTENNCYNCPEGQKLEMQQIYHEKDRDKIIYYTNACLKCPSKDKCLTEKMTTKIITDYVSNSTEKLKYRMQTTEAQEKYKERMPNSESKFAYNKHTLKYRQYHIKGQQNAQTQQTLMATAQNLIKIHNIQQQTKQEKQKNTNNTNNITKNNKKLEKTQKKSCTKKIVVARFHMYYHKLFF